MRQRSRTKGQALVEFALSATLIFFMLAAAVDMGLIFFTLQGLHNAAQEGATYGSRWADPNNPSVLDYSRIRDRARHEAGDRGIGFVDLLDLNDNNTPDDDVSESGVLEEYIQVQALNDANGDGEPDNPDDPCLDLTDGKKRCFIRVIVSIEYNMVFPLAPAFGDRIRLSSSYYAPMRTGFFQS